ncbi:MAG: nucleotidyl transferase AbiEii/AbiGii toxin family protein [Nanoarchaeota archaeon]|nr:nucleotidyl transferase AbiEii/AbiGii toxin family protein [Nanoarchaeota archaeon]
MASKINIEQYISEIKKRMSLNIDDDIIKKDLLLTLILAEFEKMDLGRDLIFKGGTLLSRNYLKYHRFSEDLDFVFKDSSTIRDLPRSPRERKIKEFIDSFTPKLKEVADALNLDFSIDRSNTKYCRIMHPRLVYTFKLYYSDAKFIKVEINFVEKLINEPKKVSIKAITDFFDSKVMLYELGLSYQNFNVLSYSLEEIKLEKYRAILTRKYFQERDLFDLFLIKDSLNADISLIIEKIKNSSLIKRDLTKLINEKLILLQNNSFFESKEKVENLSIIQYDKKEFEEFKEKIKPILIEICHKFLAE